MVRPLWFKSGFILLALFVLALPNVRLSAAPAKVALSVALEWRREGWRDMISKTAEQFQKSHPNVQIELVSVGDGEPRYMERLAVLAASGAFPDVFPVTHRYRLSLINQGFISDLTPFVRSDPRYLESFLPPLRESLVAYDRIWGLPYQWDAWTAQVNLDAFQGAGLEHPNQLYQRNQWNFDSLPQLGRKLTKRGAEGQTEQIGILTNGDNEVSFPWVWGLGGRIYNQEGAEVFLNDQKVREGFQFFADLLNQQRVANIMATPGGVGSTGFHGGKWGINLWWTDVLPFYRQWNMPYETDVLPFPAGPRSDGTTLIRVQTWSISTQSKQKDLAWEFIRFASSSEVDKLRIEELANFPLHLSNIPFAANYFQGKYRVNNFGLLFQALATKARAWSPPVDVEAMHTLSRLLQPVWLGQQPLAPAIEEGQRLIAPLLEKARRAPSSAQR